LIPINIMDEYAIQAIVFNNNYGKQAKLELWKKIEILKVYGYLKRYG
jgi:hypothetical protein